MEAHVVLGASARWFIPFNTVFALVMLVNGSPGDGVGMRAGLTLALAMAAHGLVFGVEAAKSALPAWAARWALAVGVIAVSFAAMLPGHPIGGQVMEAGLFAMVAASAALVLTILIGRAPTLRDTE
ncbi:MAG: MnhB domain-containing protein [Terricaulis sp.]